MESRNGCLVVIIIHSIRRTFRCQLRHGWRLFTQKNKMKPMTIIVNIYNVHKKYKKTHAREYVSLRLQR